MDKIINRHNGEMMCNGLSLKEVLERHREWLLGKGGCRANLSGADLRGADLRGARMGMADLTGADPTGADMTGAILDAQSQKGT